MARGVDGRLVFMDEQDRRCLLRSLARLKRASPFSLLAYCLMGNHFHLAIRVEATSLSSLMRRLLTSYVMIFNNRHHRTGHLFQARYKAIPCRNDTYLLALVRYIHMNPVRAGLTDDPIQWPWSSHQDYTRHASGTLSDTELVFGALRMSSAPETSNYSDWMSIKDPLFEPWPQEAPISERALAAKSDPDLEKLAQEHFSPIDIDLLRSQARTRRAISIKRAFSLSAIRRGRSLTDIARWLGYTVSGVHRLLRRTESQHVKD